MINYCSLDIFALIVLLIILFNSRNNPQRQIQDHRIFILLLYFTALLLVVDVLMILIDGCTFPFSRALNYMISTINYILTPIPFFLWVIYIELLAFNEPQKTKKKLLPLALPVLIMLFGAMASLFTNFFFVIDADNIYHRGDFFILSIISCYSYVVYAILRIALGKSKLPRMKSVSLMMFILPPVLGGILQSLFYGISTIWPGVVIALLFLYINRQNLELHTDHLTGLSNRREMDAYFYGLLERKNKDSKIAGIMIDLDDFKKINDRFGHAVGDVALEKIAEILRGSFRRNDFIARYGGDEFAILLTVRSVHDVENAISRLKANLLSFNRQGELPFSINLSVGYDFYQEDIHDFEEFIEIVDMKMYQDKRNNRCG